MRAAGIVLAGGGSRRMGRDKARLDWHGRPLVVHVVAVLQAAGLAPIVVVRAAERPLPSLPPEVVVAVDAAPDRGPLEGLLAGLESLPDDVEAAFATAVDAPLLHPAFVAAVLRALGPDDEAAVPLRDGRRQPLAAAYRPGPARAAAQALRSSGRARAMDLLDGLHVRELPEAVLRQDPVLATADPELRSLVGVNDPVELDAARRLADGERPGLSPHA